MATSAQLISSAADEQLRARIAAMAQAVGHDQVWTDIRMGQIVAAGITGPDGSPTTIADMYGYAFATWDPTKPLPGMNPAAVTDKAIAAAIEAAGKALDAANAQQA